MNQLEVTTSLTTEEIKEKIRAIGNHQFSGNTEQGYKLILNILFGIFIISVGIMLKFGKGEGIIYEYILPMPILFLPFIIVVLGLKLHDSDKFNEILHFLENVISSYNVISLRNQKLQILVSIDTIEKEIDPTLVTEIKNIIQEITHNIKSIDGMEQKILEKRKYNHIFRNKKEYIYYLDLFIGTYKKELSLICNDIEKSIQDWLTLHTQELEEIEKNINQNNIPSGIMDIQAINLNSYIQELRNSTNQIQVTIHS